MDSAPQERNRRRTGKTVLDIALEEAEEKKKRKPSELPFPTVRFVSGGFNRNGDTIKELGIQPTLITSKATNTGEEEDGESPPVVMEPRKRCEIPLDYTRINRMQLEGYLTRTYIFDMTRLYLAYLSKNRGSHYEGQTATSVKVKLRALGFPEEEDRIREIYFGYCRSQGINTEETEKDLQILAEHISGKKMSQRYAMERT